MVKKNYSQILAAENSFKKSIVSLIKSLKCVSSVKNISTSKERVSIYSDMDIMIVLSDSYSYSDIAELKSILYFFSKKYPKLSSNHTIIIPNKYLYDLFTSYTFLTRFSEKTLLKKNPKHLSSEGHMFTFFLSEIEKSFSNFIRLRSDIKENRDFDKKKYFTRISSISTFLNDWQSKNSIQPIYGSYKYVQQIRTENKKHARDITEEDLISFGKVINTAVKTLTTIISLNTNHKLTILKSDWYGKVVFSPKFILTSSNFLFKNKKVFFSNDLLSYYDLFLPQTNHSALISKNNDTDVFSITMDKRITFFKKWKQFLIKNELTDYCNPLPFYLVNTSWRKILSI